MHLINQSDLPATLITKEKPSTTPKRRSPSQNTFDPELSQHPIFQWREDDILSGLVQSLENLIRIEPNPKVLTQFSGKFQGHIHDITFSGKKIKELSDSQVFGRLAQKGACAKPLIEPDIYFRCLDCEKTHELQSSLCSDCFDKSNHDGHRIIQVRLEQGINALCDCGDSEVFNPEGFCPEHRSVQLTTKELMQQFPSIIFERYQLVVKKAFYGVFSCFEIAQRDNDYQRKALLTAFSEQCFNELLGFCESCFQGIHESFLQVLGIAVRAKLLSPYNTVWHNCDDLKAESDPSKVDVENSHNCKCSILGNLFRIGNIIGRLSQVRLEKILLECGKEGQFKMDLAVEYTRFVHFLFGRDYERDDEGVDEDKVNSKLTTMEGHLFSKEKINLKILECGSFKNYVDILKRAIQNSSGPTSAVFYVITTAINTIFLFLDPKLKSSEVLIQQSNIIESLLDIAMRFEAKFVYKGKIRVGLFEHEVLEKEITMGFVIERIICQILDSAITTICNYEPAQKLRYTRLFIKTWYVKLLENRASESKKLEDGTVNFTPTLERIISSLILNYLENEVTMERLTGFFREALPEVEVSKLAGETVEGVLKSLGAARYIIVNLCLQVNHMFGYTNQVSNIFESDIAALQIMTVFMKPENLFESFVNNFFSYTANSRDFFLNMKIDDFRKEEIQAQRDFLCFLIFLMNDEVAILSNKIRTAEIYQKELTLTTRDFSIIEKFVINLAIGAYSLPYSHLKQALVENFINNRPEIDSIIPLVTTHDQAHQIRFKDELKGEYDPYALFKLYSIQMESTTNVAAKYAKDESFDLVSGKYDETVPDYLKQIQRNIFQSSLPQFLCRYIENFSNAISELLHPALKLILLNLQVTNEAVTKESAQKDALLENITKNYSHEAFKAGLNKINQDEKYKECRLCINKIKLLLKTLTGEDESNESVEQDHHNKATQEEQVLKQKALDRMNKLKEQFAKKQALFADKNKPGNEAQNTEEVKKDSEGLICQHCLEAVGPQSKQDYGFPIYVTFTNNFYDTDKEAIFKEQDYSDLSKVSWWPVISSCYHYYHKKCYSELHRQNNIEREDKANDFISADETQCSFCKSLCNNFVCVNNSKNSGFFGDLCEDLQFHALELKERLLKNVSAPSETTFEVDSEEIFRRAYEYFIEAFHLYEEPKQLKKSFEVYAFFLRSLSYSLSQRRRLGFTESSLLRQISQKFKSEVNPNFLLGYQPEALLDRELFKILTLDRASETHNDELIRSHMTSLLEEYLTFKVIQLLATEKTTSIVKVQDCIEYFKNNLSFQEKVRSELVFPLKKIVLSWCLNLATSLDLSFANSDLFEILGSSKGDLSDLLSQCGLTSSFEDRVLKALQHHSIDPASEVLLNSVLNTKSLSGIPSVPKARKMAPRVVKLPETYAEYSNKYIKIKCSLCHKLSVPIGLAICLICDKATCFMCCSTHGERGNLNGHAINYHLGLGYFLDKISLDRWVINTPKNGYLAIKEIYIDNLGQSIKTRLLNQFTVHNADFKQYLLNPQIDQEMQETIRNHNMGKALFKGVIEVQDRFAAGIW